MKLIDLGLRERFMVPEEEARRKLKERLWLTDDEVSQITGKVFVVVVKYFQEWISVGDTTTASEIKLMKKLSFPGDLEIIPV